MGTSAVVRGEPRETTVAFVLLTADAKGRLFGLDRAGRVWQAVRNTEGALCWWERLTERGYIYASA